MTLMTVITYDGGELMQKVQWEFKTPQGNKHTVSTEKGERPPTTKLKPNVHYKVRRKVGTGDWEDWGSMKLPADGTLG